MPLNVNFKSFHSDKIKVSVSWQWNLVNEAIMLLSKDVSNNFTKTMLWLRDAIKLLPD